MAKKKVVLTFPPEIVTQPITYHLVKDFDLVINILRAEIYEEEAGRMLLELSGEEKSIDEGLKYLIKQGVEIQEAARDIELDKEQCVDCGACTAVCPTTALTINQPSWLLQFNKEDCVLCGLCVRSCPTKAISVTF